MVRQISEGSTTIKEARDLLIVAKVTADMTIAGRNFLNLRNLQDLRTALGEWIAINGSLSSAFKTVEMSRRFQPYSTSKPSITCFHCGKQATDCWSKKRQQKEQEVQVKKEDVKPIVCFNCQEVGHKANACTKPRLRRKDEGKRVQTTPEPKEVLRQNEAMATVGNLTLPVTMDTGAVLPKEFVAEKDYTGKMVEITVANGNT